MSMSEIFVSGNFRICASCLGDIGPDDRCQYVHGEITCIPCRATQLVERIMTEQEEERLEEL